ncbi:hypothetical protein N9H90_01535 [Pseudomonadales bacterium]|nr:hypothetical protein [Pseudomonadales bacterium]
MNKIFFDLNHERLTRTIGESGVGVVIHRDLVNPNEPQMHFIEVGEKVVHAIPCYNVDDVNVRQYTDFFVEKGGITGILPVKQLSSSKVSDLIKIKRPSLLNLKIYNDLGVQWNLLHKSKKRNVLKVTKNLEFGIDDNASGIKKTFIDTCIKAQRLRATQITNFFDEKSLEDILSLPESMVFYARNRLNPSSILFHLNFFCNDVCYFLFSSSSSPDSRGFSAALHWQVIKWLSIQESYNYYSLGGGVKAADGIEQFKIQLGAIREDRHYAIFPTEKYLPDDFFPSSHRFLANTY